MVLYSAGKLFAAFPEDQIHIDALAQTIGGHLAIIL